MSELLSDAYARITACVDDLDEEALGRPTRTEWSVAELLWHQCLDAVRSLAAFSTLTDEEPDVDAVSYWRPFRPDEGDGGAEHAAYVRAAAGAFAHRRGVVDYWRLVGPACARAAEAARPGARVSTQGHVIAVPDFTSTLVVESTVHLLDLSLELPDAPSPSAAALSETRRVLERLQDGPLPGEWDDTEAVLRATGRLGGWPVLLG